MKRSQFAPSALLFLSPAIAIYARADVYLSEAQAVNAIFPGAKADEKSLALSPAEVEAIEKSCDQKVRSTNLKVYKIGDRGVVLIDEVLGKHEFITYAVGIGPDGKVKGVEVLEYRESYGQGVRKHEWNNQFIGKNLASPLKIGDDIKNISGATLSSSHLTAGVKRVLVTYMQIHNRI